MKIKYGVWNKPKSSVRIVKTNCKFNERFGGSKNTNFKLNHNK